MQTPAQAQTRSLSLAHLTQAARRQLNAVRKVISIQEKRSEFRIDRSIDLMRGERDSPFVGPSIAASCLVPLVHPTDVMALSVTIPPRW